MLNIHEDETEAEIDVATLGTCTVGIVRRVRWSYDPSYGADADGRRGAGQWFFDELDPRVLYVLDEDGTELTALTEKQQAGVERALASWLKRHAPEPPEPDDSED